MVFSEMTSGICFGILYQCLVRQRILFLRQSTELDMYKTRIVGDIAPRAVFFPGVQAHDAGHHGRFGPEEQSCAFSWQ